MSKHQTLEALAPRIDRMIHTSGFVRESTTSVYKPKATPRAKKAGVKITRDNHFYQRLNQQALWAVYVKQPWDPHYGSSSLKSWTSDSTQGALTSDLDGLLTCRPLSCDGSCYCSSTLGYLMVMALIDSQFESSEDMKYVETMVGSIESLVQSGCEILERPDSVKEMYSTLPSSRNLISHWVKSFTNVGRACALTHSDLERALNELERVTHGLGKYLNLVNSVLADSDSDRPQILAGVHAACVELRNNCKHVSIAQSASSGNTITTRLRRLRSVVRKRYRH